MTFRSIPLYPKRQSPTAVAFGPTVLAFRAEDSPALRIDFAHLAANFVPVAGEALTYHLRTDPDVLVRPFYSFKEGEPYYLYLDSHAPGHLPHRKMQINGPWRDSGKHWYSNTPGSWCEGTFNGVGVRLLAYLFEDAGHAEVSIDGKVVKVIDEYNPKRDVPQHWDFTGLSPGKHTLRVTVLPVKSPASTNLFINVAGLETIKRE